MHMKIDVPGSYFINSRIHQTVGFIEPSDLRGLSFLVIFSPEIPLPNEQARLDILKIHSAPIAKHGEIGE